MSSTKRSKVRQEHASDYYVTPTSEIRNFLSALREDLCLLPLAELWRPDYERRFDGARILDPAGVGDVKHEMSYPAVLRDSWIKYSDLLTMDVREDSRAGMKENYLTAGFDKGQFDVIITNPPFMYATEYIEKSLELLKHDGLLILLLRLNFFGSEKRKKFLQETMPFLCYVHSKRMSFGLNKKGKKGTDSIEYCHSVWVKGANPVFTRMRVI